MKNKLFVFILIAVVTGSVFADNKISENVARAFRAAGIQVFNEGAAINDFTLRRLDGRNFTLSQQRGKVVFLNFWATWCPPCHQEMPSMEALYQRLKNRGLEMAAVNLGESRNDVYSYMTRNNLSFPALIDTRQVTVSMYGIRSIPTTYIIDRRGLVIARFIGSTDWNSSQVVSAFETLLAE
ncbi:MAG: TlpA family protein disulfide reductase [Treponema sp.]|jgi:peroxiredoxin|nr:TlpA family protein disulfide reductase [Treponema sp.]